MMDPMVSALSEDARREAAHQLATIRKVLGASVPGMTVVQQVRIDALGDILTVAAPRLRALVEERGTQRDDKTVSLGLAGGAGTYVLTLASGNDTDDDARSVLMVRGPGEDEDAEHLFEVEFVRDKKHGSMCVARGRSERELAILAALDSLRTHMPTWDGTLAPGRRRAAAEMIRADGGFPGATCRDYLDTLRDEAVRGMMLAAARALPELAGLQEAGGYRWGERYLAYDDTDKRGCRIPAPDTVACFHEDIDLFDDHASWVVGVQKALDGPGRVSAWAFDRSGDDPVQAIERMMPPGLEGLGQPHLSVDLATGAVLVREGFDPGCLAGNVLHGVVREIEVLKGRSSDPGRFKTEDRTDFGSFTPDPEDEDFDPEDEDLDDEGSTGLGPRR